MRRMFTGVGVVMIALSAVSCSRKAVVESGPAAGPAATTARGTVRRLGSEGSVRTVVQGDATLVVLGDYEPELARIPGATVWVSGSRADSPYGAALTVSEYRILSVDGEVPVVGILGRDQEGFYVQMQDGGIVRVDVSDRLATQVGAKIWAVLGPDQVTVVQYGILRD